MKTQAIPRVLLCLAVTCGFLLGSAAAQSDDENQDGNQRSGTRTTTTTTGDHNATTGNTGTDSTGTDSTGTYSSGTTTGTAGTTHTGTGPFVPGKVYAVTSVQKTIQFAGKDVVLPQGVQFQFQDGYLVISLPQEADRNVAIVRLGKTYLVVTKTERLAIDPTGIAQTRNRRIRRIRPLQRPRIIRAVNDAPDASPIRP